MPVTINKHIVTSSRTAGLSKQGKCLTSPLFNKDFNYGWNRQAKREKHQTHTAPVHPNTQKLRPIRHLSFKTNPMLTHVSTLPTEALQNRHYQAPPNWLTLASDYASKITLNRRTHKWHNDSQYALNYRTSKAQTLKLFTRDFTHRTSTHNQHQPINSKYMHKKTTSMHQRIKHQSTWSNHTNDKT